MLMEGFMREIGLIILSMAKVMKNLQMDQYTKVTMFKENQKVVADMSGKMDNFMKDNGLMV